jgi:branched-chain amino acid transport system permease protein
VTVLLQQLVNGLTQGAIYALIALGYTMVYGTLQLINFAHGEVYMVGAFMGMYVAKWTGVADAPTIPGVLLVALVTMVFCAVLGMTIERVAYRPMRKSTRLNMLITAIGVSLLLQNLGLLVFGAIDNFPPLLPKTQWTIGGVVLRSNDLVILGTTVTLMIILHQLVERTQIGRAMRAVSHSRDTAALMGIPVDRVIAFTFAVGSTLAAAAALLVAMDKGVIQPQMGATGGLKAFTAAVLGGIGSIPGAVLGGVVLGVCETLVSAFLASSYRDAIAFGVLIVVLLVRPAGLLGRATIEKV